MTWRDVAAAASGLTPSRGYLWPGQADGRLGVRKCERDLAKLMAENDRLRTVADAAIRFIDADDIVQVSPEASADQLDLYLSWKTRLGELRSAVHASQGSGSDDG